MKVVTIGRNEVGNDIVIKDNYVSHYHVQILQDDDGSFRLIDLNSRNGTYVNGRRVRGEVDLSEHDFVRIGNTTLPWKEYFEGLEYPSVELSDGTSSSEQTGKRNSYEESKQGESKQIEEEEDDDFVRLAFIIAGAVVGLGMIVLVLSRLI